MLKKLLVKKNKELLESNNFKNIKEWRNCTKAEKVILS